MISKFDYHTSYHRTHPVFKTTMSFIMQVMSFAQSFIHFVY